MKNFSLKTALAAVLFFLAAFPAFAESPVDIRIDRSAERLDLGLSQFETAGQNQPAGALKDFHETIQADLDFSRLFNLVTKGPLVKGRAEAVEWAKFGSRLVAGGEIRGRSGSRVRISGRIYDAASGDVVYKFTNDSESGLTRALAHQVSNEIFKYVTGEEGAFTSHIVFVNDSTGRKELYIADYDGENLKRLTNDNSIVILPRLSQDGESIIFTSYMSGNPDLYLIQPDGRGRVKVSSKAGLNVSPSWAPNNREMLVTLSKDGPPNIYLMDVKGRVLRRMTDSRGADTAPAFSHDGQKIAFTSDRPGSPHIYVMNADGTGLRRVTTDGHCDSAAWSPDGKTLVYVKGKSGARFDIYSIDILTGVERRLTWGEGDNENPAWSPDGRSIIFTSTRRGKSTLYTMAFDGSDPKPVPINLRGASFTPHWSN